MNRLDRSSYAVNKQTSRDEHDEKQEILEQAPANTQWAPIRALCHPKPISEQRHCNNRMTKKASCSPAEDRCI